MANKESSSVSNIWTQRSLGISLPKNLESELHANVEYPCNNLYPFLQLVNVNAVFTEETVVNFIPASTGWIIHDYGEAIKYGFGLSGYTPDANDEKCYDRLVKNAKTNGLVWEKQVAKKPKNEISSAG